MNARDVELLTERELEVMHVFWTGDELTAHDARDRLEANGRKLTYTTVANLCRLLCEKGFLNRKGKCRPFTFRQAKSFSEVSSNLVTNLVDKLFRGSREQLLLQVLSPQQLSQKKQKLLQELLDDFDEPSGQNNTGEQDENDGTTL